MQASLPKVVRMVSVEDLGQGSESIRILGVRWLPRGAASKSVSNDGDVDTDEGTDQGKTKQEQLDEAMSMDSSADKNKGASEEEDPEEEQMDNVAQGMEAEEGDFVNMEIAFAYRARGGGKDMQSRAKNAHLYLAFYLPANVKLRKLNAPVCNLSC